MFQLKFQSSLAMRAHLRLLRNGWKQRIDGKWQSEHLKTVESANDEEESGAITSCYSDAITVEQELLAEVEIEIFGLQFL